MTVYGVRVTDLADTWVDLGEVMSRGLDVDDLVIAGDVVANRCPSSRSTRCSTRARDPGTAAPSRWLSAWSAPGSGREWRPGRDWCSTGPGSPSPRSTAPSTPATADGSRRETSSSAPSASSASTRAPCTPASGTAVSTPTATGRWRTRGGRCWRSSPRTSPTGRDGCGPSPGSPAPWLSTPGAGHPVTAFSRGGDMPTSAPRRVRVSPPLDEEGRARVTRRGVRCQA